MPIPLADILDDVTEDWVLTDQHEKVQTMIDKLKESATIERDDDEAE